MNNITAEQDVQQVVGAAGCNSSELFVWTPNNGISAYRGTRAMLEAEGIIPEGTKWPEGYDAVLWKTGQFDWMLRRERPPGAKGPRRAFVDVDWFLLRWDPVERLSWEELEILRRTRELKDAIYKTSAKGKAERSAQWHRYWKAENDKLFQALGIVQKKRGRPLSSAKA